MKPREVLAMCREKEVKAVDLRFADFLGAWQHFTIPVGKLEEDTFDDGLGFDGSSIRGWQAINESDMLLVPVPESAVLDPFTALPTLALICSVQDPITREDYSRDPRHVARKAGEHGRHAQLAHRLDDVFGAEDVRPLEIAGAPPHPGERGHVEDDVVAGHGGAQAARVEDVHPGLAGGRRGLVARGPELAHELGAEEAVPARDERLHRAIPAAQVASVRRWILLLWRLSTGKAGWNSTPRTCPVSITRLAIASSRAPSTTSQGSPFTPTSAVRPQKGLKMPSMQSG
jgi:hypothetical protein